MNTWGLSSNVGDEPWINPACRILQRRIATTSWRVAIRLLSGASASGRRVARPRATLVRVGRPEVEAIRRIALALPEVTERWSHGAPCFFVRESRALCYVHDNHRGDGRISLWCPARPGVQEELVSTEPERFFRPPTSASGTFSSWVGVFLDLPGDDEVDWREVAAIIEEAFCLVAPKELIAQLEAM